MNEGENDEMGGGFGRGRYESYWQRRHEGRTDEFFLLIIVCIHWDYG